eukprot:scaffold5640_cov30-Tisochrysis_lutea.AAC.10
MPLVVADIVEPANTHAATCTALTALLDPLDSHLAPVPAGSDDDLPAGIAPPEPLRLAASPDAEAGCTWLSELRAPNDAAGETKCLDAAVALFGAVFRLQTSGNALYPRDEKQVANGRGTISQCSVQIRVKHL